jgi:hypothetical protein
MVVIGAYLTFFIMGLLTTIIERRHIHARRLRILTNLFTFPLFMLTYVPISIVDFFKKVEWVPTKHDIAVNFEEVIGAYITFFFMGLLTTVVERSHIHAKRSRIISNLFTFPLFMLTYVPIGVVAFFKKVEWVPTKHDIAVNFEDVVGDSA